ncbi:MAG: glycosyltransferase family 4 protein [Pseudomonadales bacterium]
MTLNLYWNPVRSRASILHFFNGVCLSRQKWVVTYEATVPRLGFRKTFDWLIRLAVNKLVAPNCIKLIAMSRFAYKIQKRYLEINYPEHTDSIMSKTVILHPPQKLLVADLSEKPPVSDGIVFTFIGNEFFRKGGREIIEVFQKLDMEGYNFTLNIISSFVPDAYASDTSISDQREYLAVLARLPKSTKIYSNLENHVVVSLLRKTHVALLPTYADTYGYSVLEAQACGCPVISTDIEALPEINNGGCGWIISLPKDDIGYAILGSQSKIAAVSEAIMSGLYQTVTDIYSSPEVITRKAEASLCRIASMHDPGEHGRKLEKIYQCAYVN